MSAGATCEPTLEDVLASAHRIPRDVATDGAYASRKHQQIAQQLGIKHIVLTKVVGSLQHITSRLHMETRFKKWRRGIEAVISDVTRGCDLRRCSWKGEAHLKANVFWRVIADNLRVMSRLLLRKLVPQLAS